MTAPTPETAARQMSMDDVDAYFAREGIHTYRELLEVLQSTDDELEQAEKALAAVAAERDQARADLVKETDHCRDTARALRQITARWDQARQQLSALGLMARSFADVVEERDQARQMLADAPHADSCWMTVPNKLRDPKFVCDCWKAGL